MIELTKEYISTLIEQRGMTKSEFAAKMGYPKRQYLDAVLNNQKKDINTVVRMADVLGIPLLEFIGENASQRNYGLYGVIYVNGIPEIVNNRQDIQDILNKTSE